MLGHANNRKQGCILKLQATSLRVERDVVVLAGDIGNQVRGDRVGAEHLAWQGKFVCAGQPRVLPAGTHGDAAADAFAPVSWGVHLLDNDEVVIVTSVGYSV